MFDIERIRRDFSQAALSYDDNAALQHRVLMKLLEKTQPHLPSYGKILDAGCGTGRLAALLPSYPVIQLDVASAMCDAAHGKGAAINGTVEALPFADGAFDTVFCSLVMQWLTDTALARSEMLRVLRPGGVLAISTFAEGTLRELRESFAAIDAYPHVSPFAGAQAFTFAQTITEFYPDLQTLMQRLKAIGAGNKLAARRKSLMTARQLGAVEAHYRTHFGTARGLPVTWKVAYEIITKS